MEKGTILYVGNFELPDKGASANRVVSNGKIFQKLGYQTAYLGVKKGESFAGVQVLDSERHMYEEAYPQGSKQWLAHMVSVKNIQTLVNKYDTVRMIILYNVPFSLLVRAKHVFSKKNIKVVYDCTEWTGVTEGSFVKRRVKRFDEYFIRNKIGDVADGLIVISSMMAEAYRKCNHMILLPPLVDLYEDIWHQDRKRDDNTFEFCFAGMLDGNKESLDSIVAAMKDAGHTNCRLRIIGVTKEEFCNHYPNGSALLDKVKDSIIFMGRLSHFETIRYVLQCDCYIFIRQSDIRNNAGFPTKFAEAFSCGMPIITTDISDIKEYMNTNKTGQLLHSTSAEEVKLAMKNVFKQRNSEKEFLLNETFHYESYVDASGEWMEQIFS